MMAWSRMSPNRGKNRRMSGRANVGHSEVEVRFMRLGLEYYVTARAAARFQLSIVVGNLYHHAIEMMLKSRLSKMLSDDDLRKIGHDLKKLWRTFKTDFPAETLREFDQVVATIHRYESIRYPAKLVAEGRPHHTVGIRSRPEGRRKSKR